MPNYVTNCIVFKKSDWDKINQEFVLDDNIFNFKKIVPPPPIYYDDEKSQELKFSWYSWSLQNWGTKWNSIKCDAEIQYDKVYLRFLTAWSPPEPIIHNIVVSYGIGLDCYCFDEGVCFWGKYGYAHQSGLFIDRYEDWDNQDTMREIYEMVYQCEMPDWENEPEESLTEI
jgi:hypothetical protein